MIATYTYQRGEPISYALRVKSGDPTGYTITAKLKPVGPGENEPPAPSVASVADFTPTFVPAAGEVPAHWILTIDAATSAGLEPGRYITDEKLSFGEVPVNITDPVIIRIKNSVSG